MFCYRFFHRKSQSVPWEIESCYAFAWAVFIGELMAPLIVILGYQTHISALLTDFNMLVAIAMVHSHELVALGSNGGWSLELQGFFLFVGVVVSFTGPGRYKLKN